MRSKILAHITGAICVGKSTLRKNLELFMLENNINNIKLIEFDSYDARASHSVFNKRRDIWRLESKDKIRDLEKIHKSRQKYLEDDINSDNHIILFGMHQELDTEYKFNTPIKIILVRKSLQDDEHSIISSRIKRDKDMNFFKKYNLKKNGIYKKFKSDYNKHYNEMKILEDKFGYNQMKFGNVYELLKNLILFTSKQNEY